MDKSRTQSLAEENSMLLIGLCIQILSFVPRLSIHKQLFIRHDATDGYDQAVTSHNICTYAQTGASEVSSDGWPRVSPSGRPPGAPYTAPAASVPPPACLSAFVGTRGFRICTPSSARAPTSPPSVSRTRRPAGGLSPRGTGHAAPPRAPPADSKLEKHREWMGALLQPRVGYSVPVRADP